MLVLSLLKKFRKLFEFLEGSQFDHIHLPFKCFPKTNFCDHFYSAYLSLYHYLAKPIKQFFSLVWVFSMYLITSTFLDDLKHYKYEEISRFSFLIKFY